MSPLQTKSEADERKSEDAIAEEQQTEKRTIMRDLEVKRYDGKKSGTQKDEASQDDCFELDGEYDANVLAPQYNPILCTGDDDDDEPRRMLGYAAYHGRRYVPAEVKDNLEHFFANNPMPAFLKRFGEALLGSK